jgi:multiple sugar transport system substrate-binding protein
LESIQGTNEASRESKKQNITLTALLEDQGDSTRWKSLIEPAMQKLKERHPDLEIEINYTTSPYNVTRLKILSALEDKAPLDLITIDQIWLGEFAGKGLLTELGAVNLIGINQTGMVEYTKIRFTVYGRGQMYEVSGIGRTC